MNMDVELHLNTLTAGEAVFTTWVRFEAQFVSVPGRGVRLDAVLSREEWEAAGSPSILPGQVSVVGGAPRG